jgi:hypothetical protein
VLAFPRRRPSISLAWPNCLNSRDVGLATARTSGTKGPYGSLQTALPPIGYLLHSEMERVIDLATDARTSFAAAPAWVACGSGWRHKRC